MNVMFLSGFSSCLDSMITFKKSVGFSETTYVPRAKNFDRYCLQKYPKADILSKTIALDWLERRPNESTSSFHNRASFLRCFGRYQKAIGLDAYILPNQFTGNRTNFIPYMFTEEELSALFRVIDQAKSRQNALQPMLFSTIFRMIYTCGLRPNEGRNLKRSDVNLVTGEVLITETKHHKERIVIMSDDMRELAKKYAYIRDAAYFDSPYFFPDASGNAYTASWIQNKFKVFFAAANPGIDAEMLPFVRVYNLRHQFASTVLNRWLDEKQDLYARLPYLRTYMGHKEISATAYYIHLLPEKLIKSAGIDWGSLRRMIPEVELWEE